MERRENNVSAPDRARPAYRAWSLAERPDLRETIVAADHNAFPPFMQHTDLQPLWDVIHREFAHYQLVLCDAETGQHAAHGNMVPFAWDGTPDTLPATAPELIARALDYTRAPNGPAALSALQVVVNPALQGEGLSVRTLAEMAALAAARGHRDLLAPIRPNHKDRYPLVLLDDYVGWIREDGLPRDPWQRVHVRLGATPGKIAAHWFTVNAPISCWTEWTGMAFPQSGSYTVPGALEPIAVDLERDLGTYHEPHLWMHYRITPTSTAAGPTPL